MKTYFKTIPLLFSIGLSLTSFADDLRPLNLDYGSMIKNVNACKRSVYGCTIEQELEIAQFEGKVLDSYQLKKHLTESSESVGEGKSYFIPLSLTDKELLLLAASTSLGVVAFKNDQEMMDVVQAHKSKTTEVLSSIGNFYGSSAFGFVAAGSYFLGVYYDNNNLKKVGLFTIAATVAQSIVVTAAKSAFGRQRPVKDAGPYSFFQPDSKSFYSGHTSTAFALATVLSEMYKEEYPVVPYVAYGLATLTAYARMHDKSHWASDVVAGAIAGHLIAKLTMNVLNNNTDNRSGFKIYPTFNPETGSMMVMAEWKEREREAPLKCQKMPEGMAKVDACLAEGFAKAAKK